MGSEMCIRDRCRAVDDAAGHVAGQCACITFCGACCTTSWHVTGYVAANHVGAAAGIGYITSGGIAVSGDAPARGVTVGGDTSAANDAPAYVGCAAACGVNQQRGDVSQRHAETQGTAGAASRGAGGDAPADHGPRCGVQARCAGACVERIAPAHV